MPKNQTLKPIRIIGAADGENGWYAETSDHLRLLGPFLTRENGLDEINTYGARLSEAAAQGGIAGTGKSY